MILAIIVLLVGLTLLGYAANHLINTSVRIAKYFKVSSLLIGLTVLAMGTSAPELFLSGMSALNGSGSLSVGNIIGSNIFNLGFILGLSAIVAPIIIQKKLVYRDGLFLILITLLILFMLRDQEVLRQEGAILLALLVGYNSYLWFKKESGGEEINDIEAPLAKNFYILFAISLLLCMFTGKAVDGKFGLSLGISSYGIGFLFTLVIFFIISSFRKKKGRGSERELGMILNFAKLLASLGILVMASDLVVNSAVFIAQHFGVSEWAIGATIIAAGTSLPEVAATLAAIVKKKYDMGIGNVVGSDIFNILGIIGISSIITPLHLQPTCLLSGGCDINFWTMLFRDNIFSVGILIATLIVTFIFMRTGWKLSKREGVALFTLAILRMAFEISPRFFMGLIGL